MRRTKEEALITRENLLNAALQAFSQRGYAATRLEDIARDAGVTRGAIYHHFGGKEELYKALVAEKSTGINQLAEEVLSGDGSPLELLRRFLISMFQYAEQDEDYRALLQLHINKVEISEGLESIVEETIAGRRQLAAYFQELLQQGIRSGEIRPDLPSETAAFALVSFINGVGLLWIQDPQSFSIEREAGALTDVFLRGLQR